MSNGSDEHTVRAAVDTRRGTFNGSLSFTGLDVLLAPHFQELRSYSFLESARRSQTFGGRPRVRHVDRNELKDFRK